MTRRQWMGVALIIGAAIVLVAYLIWPEDDPDPNPPVPAPTEVPEPITVVGYGGNIKVPFLEHPEVAAILKDRYGITVDVEAMDTQDMLCEVPLDGIDFLWAGDQTQMQIYEECRNRSDFYRNMILTPLVIYSWTDSTNALIDEGVVRLGDD